MSFAKKSANTEPLKDVVFSVAAKARQAKAEKGAENVVDASIGTLCDEDGKLVALNSVFDSYDRIDNRVKAAYAPGLAGSSEYREAVYDWVTQGAEIKLPHSVVAAAGGTGAISICVSSCLERGEALIVPEIAWGNYALMAAENELHVLTYEIFNGERFNIESIKEKVRKAAEAQDRIFLLVNDPCHNPTGYSMTGGEWEELIAFLNGISREKPVILLNDIAYIDYSYDLEASRKYMESFNDISENMMVLLAFSCSKTLTSYGLRCGAALILARDEQAVKDMESVLIRKARATWSNINNSAMANFCRVTGEGREAFLSEKQGYIDILKKRSELFISEAKEVGLECYPYREGFFVTLKMPDNKRRTAVHEALMREDIYTVAVNKGIRVGICSLPLRYIYGLAARMREILDKVE